MGSVRLRLSIMMFLQYFVWGAWVVAAAGYLGQTLKFAPSEIGWIFTTTAIGAIVSPLLVGFVADRYFATEKILAVLHLGGAICLFLSAGQTEFMPLMILMVLNGIFYMPTLALTNSISFRNIGDPEREFPLIRVWGTIGWIVAGLMVGIIIGGETKEFFYLAGGASVILAVQCLTLPHTPPKTEAGGDVFGLGAVALVKEPAFGVFVLVSFLIMTPMFFYYSFANLFLVQTDQPVPVALQTVGQICEVFFLASMPFFITRLGVKNMILIGMLAWVARYFCFASLSFPLILTGLILHGVCYDFFFVASQIYVDKKAPGHLRASAQSFIAFVSLGIGSFVGIKISDGIVGLDRYSPTTVAAVDVKAQPQVDDEGNPTAPLPAWAPTEEDTSFWSYLDLSSQIRPLIFGEEEKKETPLDFAIENDKNDDGAIEADEIPNSWVEGLGEASLTYDGESLRQALTDIDLDGDGKVTRAEWRRAQGFGWDRIWYWPAFMALGISVLFWLAFHDKTVDGKPGDEEEEADGA